MTAYLRKKTVQAGGDSGARAHGGPGDFGYGGNQISSSEISRCWSSQSCSTFSNSMLLAFDMMIPVQLMCFCRLPTAGKLWCVAADESWTRIGNDVMFLSLE